MGGTVYGCRVPARGCETHDGRCGDTLGLRRHPNGPCKESDDTLDGRNARKHDTLLMLGHNLGEAGAHGGDGHTSRKTPQGREDHRHVGPG